MPTNEEPSDPESSPDGGGRRSRPSTSRPPLTPDLELREIRKGTKPGSRYVRRAYGSQRQIGDVGISGPQRIRFDSPRSARLHFPINSYAALAILIALLTPVAAILISPIAWIGFVPLIVMGAAYYVARSHGLEQRQQLEIEGPLSQLPSIVTAADSSRERAVIVPIDEVNQAVLHTLKFARTLSDNVTAVHITDDAEDGEALRSEWEHSVPNTPLVIIESPYRSFLAPMLAYIDGIDRVDPGAYITVVLPQFVPAHFWESILHNQSAGRLKRALIHRPNTVLINVPYRLHA